MGKPVFGRFSVFFSSSGSAIGLSARITPNLLVPSYLVRVCRTNGCSHVPYGGSRVRRETSESSVSTYVTMNEGWCQPPVGATFWSLPESYRLGAPIYGDLRLKLRGKRCRTS